MSSGSSTPVGPSSPSGSTSAKCLQEATPLDPEVLRSLREKQEREEKEHREITQKAISGLPLFHGCSTESCRQIATEASSQTLPAGEVLSLLDHGPMFVIVAGSMHVHLGCSPKVELGLGSVINEAGMLGLLEVAEQLKLQPNMPTPCEAAGLTFSGAANVGAGIEMHRAAVQNLCPEMCISSGRRKLSCKSLGWLKLELRAGDDGVTLAAVPFIAIFRHLNEDSSYARFQANRKHLVEKYSALLFYAVFPGLPPEIVWSMAGVSIIQSFEAGDTIFEDGECKPEQAFLVIDKGEACITKLAMPARTEGEEGHQEVLATLRPSAIVGDACVCHKCMPFSATLKAVSQTSALIIPTAGLLEIMERFPGMTAIFMSRLREWIAFLEHSLPLPTQCLVGLELFASCDQTLLRSLGAICMRKFFFVGDVVAETGDDSLRIVEIGRCRVRMKKTGVCVFAETDSVLGERVFFGDAEPEDVTITVSSPLAWILCITKKLFKPILERYPLDEKYFKQTCHEGDLLKAKLETPILPLFRACGKDFFCAVQTVMKSVMFQPNQTICMQTAVDAGSMYSIRAGKCVIDISGRTVRRMESGDSFGERSILGFVNRRSASVIVSKDGPCICMEIPRPEFLAALEEYPNEQLYFHQLAGQYEAVGARSQWPMLQECSNQLRNLLNMYAKRQITSKGSWTTNNGEELPLNGAVLLFNGEAKVCHANGEIEILAEGSCFGEQLFLGHPAENLRIHPVTNCEVQIITPDVITRMLEECPDEREKVLQGARNEIAAKAEQQLGFPRHDPGILRYSPIFRACCVEFLREIHKQLTACIFKPGETITKHGEPGTSLLILVKGSAVNEGDGNHDHSMPLCLPLGYVCGEVNVLGSSDHYLNTLRAQSLCIVQALARSNLCEVLQEFPTENKMFETLQNEEHEVPDVLLSEYVQNGKTFGSASPEFIDIACRGADDVFFAPGEYLMKRGEKCRLGETCMYVLLMGSASVLGEFNDELEQLHKTDVTGEAGALGESAHRGATVRACPDCFVHCRRLHGVSIQMAVQAFPQHYNSLLEISSNRNSRNEQFLKQRTEWVQGTVVPILLQCNIFSNFSSELMRDIATHLELKHHRVHTEICTAGDAAGTLLILMEGKASVKTQAGAVIGCVTSGAVMGELSVLGIWERHMATLTARCNCMVVSITSELIWDVCEQHQADDQLQALRRNIDQRRKQMEQRLPMCFLPLDIGEEDAYARVIALHAERVVMAPEDTWQPPSNCLARGAYMWVFSKGRANVLLGEHFVMSLNPDATSLFPEAILHEYKAKVCALSLCEIYRVNRFDVILSVAAAASQPKWVRRFQQMIDEAMEHAYKKFNSVQHIVKMREKSKRSSPKRAKDKSEVVQHLQTAWQWNASGEPLLINCS
eukprot:TRINITY_DN13229_c0_g1_i3.p1 TRINITY_DN13229_c0_g1~~TRINITY_DN13229_c0_g1_i3.p1  ORF type:complete len:1399 (+),score=221.95 TRINITY_DN13229_c0_g1_i3:56-4252(+)